MAKDLELLDQKLAERERLEKEIASLVTRQRKERLAAIRADIARFEYTPEELFGTTAKRGRKAAAGTKATAKKAKKKAARARTQAEPKYRDPETGATWSGRGREPKWIQGRNREDFLIS